MEMESRIHTDEYRSEGERDLKEGAVVGEGFGEAVEGDADGLPDDPAGLGEGEEADEAEEGHFEIFVVFGPAEEGEVVGPLGEGPVVPEFPEESAEEAAGEEGEGAGEVAVLPVAEHGGAAEPVVDGVEEEDEAGPEGEVGDGVGVEERPEEHGRACDQRDR